MKKLILFVSLIVFSLACDTEEATPTAPVNDNFMTDKATLVTTGSIMGVNHTVSGTASLYVLDGQYTLVLDPFQSQNGPDLKVYLSKDVGASSFVRLGNLKSTSGKQSYTIPGSVQINEYPYCHVWCEQFSVEFARAELK
jgi:hypothetical protein